MNWKSPKDSGIVRPVAVTSIPQRHWGAWRRYIVKVSVSRRASYRMAALVTFVACITLCACSVFLLAMRTQPLEVDYCRATFYSTPVVGQRPGLLHYISSLYFNWTGRWAGVGVETLLLTTTPQPGAYPWLVFMLIATQCSLLYFAIWLLVGNSRRALYLGAVIAAVYWANMPGPQEGIFWIPGVVESQLPLTLVALLFALVLSRRPTSSEQSTRLAMIGASVLGFVIPAFHELAGEVLVLALSAITAFAFLSKSTRRKMWLIVWTASVIGFLVVFIAPGNSVRMGWTGWPGTPTPTLPIRYSYWATIKGTLRATMHFVLPWCLDFKHWLLAALLWLDPCVAALRRKLPGLNSFRAVDGFLLVWISLIALAIGSAIFNIGVQPPGRTMNFIYGIFLMGWIALAFLVPRPSPSFSLPPAYRAATLSIALLLLSALVVTSDNTVGSIGDIVRGRARAWDEELNRRSALLKSAGRNADVLVPPLSERPRILATYDLSDSPNGWSNRCLSQYFSVASVQIDKTLK